MPPFKCADEVGVCFKGASQGQLQSYYAHHPRLQAKRVCRPDQPQRQQHVGYFKGMCILRTVFFNFIFMEIWQGIHLIPKVYFGEDIRDGQSLLRFSQFFLLLISQVPSADCCGHMHETWWRKVPASEGPQQTYCEVYMKDLTIFGIYHFQVVVLYIWCFTYFYNLGCVTFLGCPFGVAVYFLRWNILCLWIARCLFVKVVLCACWCFWERLCRRTTSWGMSSTLGFYGCSHLIPHQFLLEVQCAYYIFVLWVSL